MQGGVFGYASMFSPWMMGAVMFGQGMSGVVCNFIWLICLIILPASTEGLNDNDFIGCMIYFSIASGILCVCVILFFINEKTEYTWYFLKKASMA